MHKNVGEGQIFVEILQKAIAIQKTMCYNNFKASIDKILTMWVFGIVIMIVVTLGITFGISL